MHKIYVIKNKINNKFYIGYTSRNLSKRFKEHLNHKTMIVSRSMRKYGAENFEIYLLYETPDYDNAMYMEKYYIKFYKPEYNISDGGKGGVSGMLIGNKNPMYGKNHSEETKKKMSLSRIGKNNGMYGKNHSEETKKLISKRKKETPYIPYNKNKKLEDMYDYEKILKIKNKLKTPKSEESKNKLRKTYKILSPKNEVIVFHGMSKFCKENSLQASAISQVLNNKRNHHKGWKRVDNDENNGV